MTELNMDKQLNVPSNIEEWTKDHVKLWVINHLKEEQAQIVAGIFYDQEVTGDVLKVLTKKDILEMGIKHGPAILIANNLKKLIESFKEGQQNNTLVNENGTEGIKKHSKPTQGTHAEPQERQNNTVNKESENISETEETLKPTAAEYSYSYSKTTPSNFDSNHANKRHTQQNNAQVNEKATEEIKKQNTHAEPQERQNNTVNKESENISTTEETLKPADAENSCSYSKTTPSNFDSNHANTSYTQHHYLPPESGTSNSTVDPVHEYKEFTNTETTTKEDTNMKFCNKVFNFAAAAACMTNNFEKLNESCKEDQQNNTQVTEKGTETIKKQSKPKQNTHAEPQERQNNTVKKESENISKTKETFKRANAEYSCSHSKTTPSNFDCNHANTSYTQHHYIPPESGTSNFIDPVHEYKEFTNTEIATKEDKKIKFGSEVFNFAAACMTNNLEKLNESCKEDQQNNTQDNEKGTERIKKQQKPKQNTHAEPQERQNNTVKKESENISKTEEIFKPADAEYSCSHSKTTPANFDCNHANKSYTQHHYLPPESGRSNYMDPVHEYKEFTNTETATKDDKKMKFCNEVFKFAAACMNARTNGTIHFGVRDKPHGEIIGVAIENRETYVNYIDQMVNKYFEEKNLDLAKNCIRPPRFVPVLCQDNTSSNLFVIEVDVIPALNFCQSHVFHTHEQVLKNNTWKKSKEKFCFVRDGASSKNILSNAQHSVAEYNLFCTQIKDRDFARKTAENIQTGKLKKSQEHGSKLVNLLTGNRGTLDNSYYKWYILVVNKCQGSHTKTLDFMHEVPWFAVLDFDPESITNGLCKAFQEKRKPSLHVPSQYQNMDNVTNEKLEELKLYQKTAWIFCNGRLDLESQDYKPLNYKLWQKEKAADVRRLISFLSSKDVLERGKFLVVFLLLSAVEDPVDPMNEVFGAFYRELSGMTDILCICESEDIFQSWRSLQTRLVSEEEMEERCIYNLDIEKVNGTILTLKSETRSLSRFLPSHGGSVTILHRKDEDLMTSLDILCANECHDTEMESDKPKFKTFIKTHEEHFYKGGKATWWNFYFSLKQYTGNFIKRDIHEKLKEQIKLWSEMQKQISVKIITLFHDPGCGGTTTSMHVLWELREKFRCAMLKRKTDSFTDIAEEVINLAVSGLPNRTNYPVLLLVDDYEEEENVLMLQNSIRSVISERYIKFEKPIVIILNCMRSQDSERSSKSNCGDSVPLTYKLSEQEQRAFNKKLMEIEENYGDPKDFYSFMIMKRNFDQSYIEGVVRNILKGLRNGSKQAQLISILALLNKYVKDSTISASMCEEFLGITAKKTYWGCETIEDTMGTYFAIMLCTEVEENGGYKGLRISHPLIAKQCIEELRNTYDIQQSGIMLCLLNTNIFHSRGIGREILCQNMQSMLLTRHRKEHGNETNTLFSPLIEEIQEHEGNLKVESVLKEGTTRFNQNAFICQALARHFYIREKNFQDAFFWAKEAKRIAPKNSFILDTLGQIYKTQLKTMMDPFNKDNPVSAAELKCILELAENASNAFKECQEQTEQSERERAEYDPTKARRYRVYNTAGYLGQIDVCLCTINILLQTPCFNSKDSLSRKHLMQYLSGKWDISLREDYKEFYDVISDFRSFLTKVNTYLKDTFDFFEDYFVYLKQPYTLKESTEYKVREKVRDYYRKYTQHFGNKDLLKITAEKDTQQGSVLRRIEDYRVGLQSYKADRFSGILQYLTDYGKEAKIMEAIVKAYNYLLQNRTDKFIMRDKQNFILANIVLHCIHPKSSLVASLETLKKYLREVLKLTELDYKHPEPYFLASLLFWPHDIHKLDSDSKHLAEYVTTLRNTFRGQYRHMCHTKQPIAHFYLGKRTDLGRLVHKGKIDEHFTGSSSELNALWQSGDIWKEKETQALLRLVHGRAENNMIYVECQGGIKIAVRPVYLGQLRSGKSIERVSFYLGFSMDGLNAYNIESL